MVSSSTTFQLERVGPVNHCVQVGERKVTFGRNPNCDVVCESNVVSRKHCDFYVIDNQLFVKDRQSSNGVYVDGARIGSGQERRLPVRSVVGLGVASTDPTAQDRFAYQVCLRSAPRADEGDQQRQELQQQQPSLPAEPVPPDLSLLLLEVPEETEDEFLGAVVCRTDLQSIANHRLAPAHALYLALAHRASELYRPEADEEARAASMTAFCVKICDAIKSLVKMHGSSKTTMITWLANGCRLLQMLNADDGLSRALSRETYDSTLEALARAAKNLLNDRSQAVQQVVAKVMKRETDRSSREVVSILRSDLVAYRLFNPPAQVLRDLFRHLVHSVYVHVFNCVIVKNEIYTHEQMYGLLADVLDWARGEEIPVSSEHPWVVQLEQAVLLMNAPIANNDELTSVVRTSCSRLKSTQIRRIMQMRNYDARASEVLKLVEPLTLQVDESARDARGHLPTGERVSFEFSLSLPPGQNHVNDDASSMSKLGKNYLRNLEAGGKCKPVECLPKKQKPQVKDKPLACPKCSYKGPHRFALNQHQLKRHGGNVDQAKSAPEQPNKRARPPDNSDDDEMAARMAPMKIRSITRDDEQQQGRVGAKRKLEDAAPKSGRGEEKKKEEEKKKKKRKRGRRNRSGTESDGESSSSSLSQSCSTSSRQPAHSSRDSAGPSASTSAADASGSVEFCTEFQDPEKGRMFQCKWCSQTSKYKRHVKRHCERKHKDSFKIEKKIVVVEGDNDPADFYIVIQDPEKGRMFQCKWCSHSCKYKYSVKMHCQSHKGALLNFKTSSKPTEAGIEDDFCTEFQDPEKGRMFRCKSCDYSSIQKHHVKRHCKKLHKGVEPHFKEPVTRAIEGIDGPVELCTEFKDPKKGMMFKCTKCNHKAMCKNNFPRHWKSMHKDLIIVEKKSIVRQDEVTEKRCAKCLRTNHREGDERCPITDDNVAKIKEALDAAKNKKKKNEKERISRYAVPCGFNKICVNDRVRDAVYEDVKELSKMAIEVSLFVEYALRHKDGALLEYFNQSTSEPRLEFVFNFFKRDYQMMERDPDAESDALRERRDLTDQLIERLRPVRAEYMELCRTELGRTDLYDCSYRRSMVDQLQIGYVRCMKTNITTHMWQRMRRFLKATGMREKRQINEKLRAIFKENDHSELPQFDRVWRPQENLDFRTYKSNWWKWINFVYRLNEYLLNAGKKGFAVVPIYKAGLKHLVYTRQSVWQLCRKLYPDLLTSEPPDADADPEAILQLWSTVFNIEKFTRRKGLENFLFTISTNSVSASLHFRRERDAPDNEEDDEVEEEDEIGKEEKLALEAEAEREMLQDMGFNKFIGIDPGLRIALACYMVNQADFDPREVHETYRLYAWTYYYRIKHERRKKIMREKTAHCVEWERAKLETPEYLEFNKRRGTTYVECTKFRLGSFLRRQPVTETRSYARLNFDRQILVRKFIDKIVNFILYGNTASRDWDSLTVFVALGTFKINQHMRGYPRVALKRIEARFKEEARVNPQVYVCVTPEHYTTRLCCKCNDPCFVSTNKHRYLYCHRCKITFNRDTAAAKNILLTAMIRRGLRPENFIPHFERFAAQQ